MIMIGGLDPDGRLWIKRKEVRVDADCKNPNPMGCNHTCSLFGEPEFIQWETKKKKGAKLSLCEKTITFDEFTDER